MASNEPSRFPGGVQARFTNLSGHKLRLIARQGNGEQRATVNAAARMFRAEEPDFYARQRPRNVHTPADVTRGLGLDNVDGQKVRKLVREQDRDTNVQRGDTPRALAARGALYTWLRTQTQIDSDVRGELIRRASAYLTRAGRDEYGKDSGKRSVPVVLVPKGR